MTGGPGPVPFMGYEEGGASPPACGGTWTAHPAASDQPPDALPPVMAVIVTTHVDQDGANYSGDIVQIVLVRTDTGYGPNPGQEGTGTVIGRLCP